MSMTIVLSILGAGEGGRGGGGRRQLVAANGQAVQSCGRGSPPAGAARPVFSRHRDTRWAVDGQEQSAEKKYTAEITHRVNM